MLNQKLLPTNYEKVMNSDRFEVWINKQAVKKGIYPGLRVDLQTNSVVSVFVVADPKTKYRVVGINGQMFNMNINHR